MNDERAATIRAMVMSRCLELTEAEVAEAFGPGDQPEEMLPASIVEQILTVIDRMTERQDRFEANLAAAAEPVILPPRLH